MTATVAVQPSKRPRRQKCAGVDDDCSPTSSRHRVQDALTLKTCKATEEMKKVVMANTGSTAMPQCSTDGMTPCAGSTAAMRHEQSDARGRAGVRHEPYREQTHGVDAGRGIVTARAGSTAGSESAGSLVACAGAACRDGGVTRSSAYSGQCMWNATRTRP